MQHRHLFRDAIRLLYILVEGSTQLPAHNGTGATAIFRGEMRLQAFDFWVRNPDYLADELLDLFEQTGIKEYLDEARQIFQADEPDIRSLPMTRFLHGAYERLDDILGILRSRDLVKVTGRTAGEKILETDYLVMPAAIELSQRISHEAPILDWYAKRARLVTQVAGDQGGTALKRRQKEKAEYAQTKYGGLIPPIKENVQYRLQQLGQGELC